MATKINTSLSKEQEIKLIRRLRAGNGYFTDSITDKDLIILENNIRDDYPLFHNTSLYDEHNKEIDKLKVERDDLIYAKDENRALYEEAQQVNEEQAVTINELFEKVKDADLHLKAEKTRNERTIVHLVKNELDDILYDIFTIYDIVRVKLECNLPLNDRDRVYLKETINREGE